ncbi:DUF7542 family protein [Halobaculum litoreum]|uniref:C2H2-type domain-containing protein n=1 Tax=Halobaculum litoreum TaxID=3031998 RepID=A0ABD5XWB1_9EURY|nr:hypothetical protein [Halobaculum sp. DT92]
MPTAATVRCTDCAYEESFDSLRHARTAMTDHERETGHVADWAIGRLAAGVERAGDDAGVCGRDGCANADTPLLDRPESGDDA